MDILALILAKKYTDKKALGLIIKVVNSLPATGANSTMYLVPNSGSTSNAYDEYIWIESTSKFEKIGTTDIDLSGYVKNTDYATDNVGGVLKTSTSSGTQLNSNGVLVSSTRTSTQYISDNTTTFIGKGTLENLKQTLIFVDAEGKETILKPFCSPI